MILIMNIIVCNVTILSIMSTFVQSLMCIYTNSVMGMNCSEKHVGIIF